MGRLRRCRKLCHENINPRNGLSFSNNKNLPLKFKYPYGTEVYLNMNELSYNLHVSNTREEAVIPILTASGL